jgi:hypothetical protein
MVPAAAAAHGQLECLQYLHQNGCPWTAYTCYSAAIKDNIDCLKYAHMNGCDLGKDTKKAAFRADPLGECNKYLSTLDL